jgi:hypothetical protein
MTDDGHNSDDDLEPFILNMVKDEAELERLEQHPLVCADCIDRADETREYIGTMKVALARLTDSTLFGGLDGIRRPRC